MNAATTARPRGRATSGGRCSALAPGLTCAQLLQCARLLAMARRRLGLRWGA